MGRHTLTALVTAASSACVLHAVSRHAKPSLFRVAPTVGRMFERKEHLAFGAHGPGLGLAPSPWWPRAARPCGIAGPLGKGFVGGLRGVGRLRAHVGAPRNLGRERRGLLPLILLMTGATFVSGARRSPFTNSRLREGAGPQNVARLHPRAPMRLCWAEPLLTKPASGRLDGTLSDLALHEPRSGPRGLRRERLGLDAPGTSAAAPSATPARRPTTPSARLARPIATLIFLPPSASAAASHMSTFTPTDGSGNDALKPASTEFLSDDSVAPGPRRPRRRGRALHSPTARRPT